MHILISKFHMGIPTQPMPRIYRLTSFTLSLSSLGLLPCGAKTLGLLILMGGVFSSSDSSATHWYRRNTTALIL